ncbi:MAG: non-ribosomal peptide synthetase [Methylobacter sp.]
MSLSDRSIELFEPPKSPANKQFLTWASLKPEMIEVVERQLEYWMSRLANLPVLEFLTDKPRPAVQSFRAETQTFKIPSDLTEKLKALAQSENATLFMTLLAAFQVLLHRYSSQDEIVIGTPTIGPNSEDTESEVDYVANTVILRTELSGMQTFHQLLAQVRKVTLEAYANQDIPFDKLVEALNPQHDSSRNPLFQLMFALQESGDAGAVLQRINPRITSLDLSFRLLQKQDDLIGYAEYSVDLFHAATISRLISHFQVLLKSIVEHPEAKLYELTLLTEPERRQLLKTWNATLAPFPGERPVHELFEAQVHATPQAVALVYDGKQWTYAELNAEANRLAHYLRWLGVRPDIRVAICLERGFNMVAAMLAVLKSGGAYVPLDPAYPQERLALMLEDSEPLVLLTQNRFEKLFTETPASTAIVDLDAEALWADQPGRNLDRNESGLAPHHLAYVIYTSGSTGKPKGVMIEHRNLVNFLNSMAKEPGIDSSDVLLAVTTISFDIAGLELFLPLSRGAKIIIASRMQAADPDFLQQTINRYGVTMLQATPATWRLLLSTGWKGSNRLKAICGGEAMTLELSSQLSARVGQLWNLYGPTETTIWSTGQLIDDKRTKLHLYESIGRPIDNTRIYILDAHLQLVPQGVVGEMYIGGAGVARGYLNRPELTAERFVADPYAAGTGARMYRTGDLARWLPDGSIEYIGRNDFQVKIRGFRIELGDIEAKLAEHPQVREVAVLAREYGDDKRLVAYLVLKSGAQPGIAELREFLQQKMPAFMVPSAFVFLDALPATPNGKLDRKALPEPSYEAADSGIAPRNEIERQLAEIWQDVLGLKNIGVDDNFFNLGGHSLLAVKAIVETNKLFNIDLPLGVFYQSPTIAELGAAIGSGNLKPLRYSLVPIRTGGSRPPLFAIHTITMLDLPKYLGQDQPIYFLRYGMAAESGNASVPLPPLLELAEHYISELQQVQPEGPYYLVGFSFGGVIAYEMARQLSARGQQVNLVGLLDSYLTEDKHLLPLGRIIQKALQQNPFQVLAQLKNKIPGLVPKDTYGTDFWPHIYTIAPDAACREGYRPGVYDGQVTLFQGWVEETKLFSYVSPEHAWRKLLGNRLDVQPVSGAHLDICREPHVKVLAEKLTACIDATIVGKSGDL